MSVDGQGVPLMKAEAVQLQATLGTGAKRQKQKEALVGVSYTVEAKPRSPAALAALLVDPDATRARRRREDTRDEAPRAQPVRRLARLVRTKPPGMERRKADAARRAPQHRQPLVSRLDGALGVWSLATKLFQEWRHRRWVRAIIPVVGSLWSAANALCGEQSTAGKRWVQQQLTEMLRGRVGYGIGGLRPILTQQRLRQAVREPLAHVITCVHNHRRWMQYDAYRAAGLPIGTGVVESACGSVVQHRMEGEGQRWRVAGAEAILTWRALQKSHDHDLRDYGRFHARQVRVRLYGHQPT